MMMSHNIGLMLCLVPSFRPLRIAPVCKVLGLLLMLLAVGFPAAMAAPADSALWTEFKKRFVTPEGRVVDTGNEGISHSEGQGYAMLLSHAYGDRETFESVWQWTQANLQVRQDPLLAWSWKPSPQGGGGVADQNNATDGDLLVAWALLRAADTWENPSWRQASQRIVQEVRTSLLRPSSVGVLLLPGREGFEKPEGTVVNLSYYLIPAFQDFESIDPSPEWRRLIRSGLGLIRQARFSRAALPPDWLIVHGKTLKPAPSFPRLYGYNAVRIPMHLAWGGVRDGAYFDPFRKIAPPGTPIPATFDLTTGKPGKDPALPGMAAIYRLIDGKGDLAAGEMQPVYRAVEDSEPYFSVSLGLLANLAARESDRSTQQ